MRASKQNLKAALITAHTPASELESTVSTLKSVEKKRARYTSASSDLDQVRREESRVPCVTGAIAYFMLTIQGQYFTAGLIAEFRGTAEFG
mgnify:FL=1